MNRLTCAALALLACGTLLLTTTQPWLRTVTQVAAGAPRARGAVTGAELVPWVAPVAVVLALAVVAGLTGMRWARGVAVAAALAVPAGVLPALLTAIPGATPAAVSGPGLVAAEPTGWLWAGAAAGLMTTVWTILWWWPWTRGSATPSGTAGPGGAGPRSDRPRAAPTEDPYGAEAERRRAAADWRELSEGGDPTGT